MLVPNDMLVAFLKTRFNFARRAEIGNMTKENQFAVNV